MKLTLTLIEKLSNKKYIQHALINLGTIQFTLQILKGYENKEIAVIESTSIILLNLLLRSKGRKVCSDMNLKALETISLVTDIENDTVRANINAALYSLLTVPEQRVEAKVGFCA